MKYWLLWAMVTMYDGASGFPVATREFVTRLPELADCAAIRQAISQDVNRLENGVSIYLECQEGSLK